uniref:Uncharacterized protein n=1 Tax=Micrurus carvalhoi TaxID=3147026 RepID=A0A2H6N069_9SAUR
MTTLLWYLFHHCVSEYNSRCQLPPLQFFAVWYLGSLSQTDSNCPIWMTESPCKGVPSTVKCDKRKSINGFVFGNYLPKEQSALRLPQEVLKNSVLPVALWEIFVEFPTPK